MKKVKMRMETNFHSWAKNAYSIIAIFKYTAKKEGWSESEIDEVLDDAQSGDYNHLLTTIGNRCE